MLDAVDIDQAMALGHSSVMIVAQAKPSSRSYPKLPMRTWGKFRMTNEVGYDRVFTWCQDVSGSTELAVAGDAINYLGYKERHGLGFEPPLDLETEIKTRVLVLPKHGTVRTYVDRKDGKEHSYLWVYSATARDEQGLATYTGKDRVVFAVDVKSHKFKAVVNLWVEQGAGDRGDVCDSKKFK